MAEVKMKGPLYKVECWEYERGYGRRFMGEKFFTTETEAKTYCEEYFHGDPDCFFKAFWSKVM